VKYIILALSLFLAMGANNAVAENASMEFLKNLDGKFRGRGLAVLPVSEREERVSCQIENAFDDENKKLSITGRCATTQGKIDVSGELLIKEDGEIEGVFISPSEDVVLKESNIGIIDDTLIISTVTYDKKKDKRSKTKQIVKIDEPGQKFTSNFELFDEEKDAFLPIGTLEFKSNKK